jgi:hypothetical protein
MKAIVIVITLFPLSLFAQYQQSTQFDFPSYTGNGGAVLGTWGTSINKNGDVSGTVEIRDPFSQITYQCFLRTQNGTYSYVPYFDDDLPLSSQFNCGPINDYDEIGGSYNTYSTGSLQAFLWSPTMGLVFPSNVPFSSVPPLIYSGISGLTNAGDAVGNLSSGIGFFLTSTGQYTSFKVPGSQTTSINGIGHDSVVGSFDGGRSFLRSNKNLNVAKTPILTFNMLDSKTFAIVGIDNNGDLAIWSDNCGYVFKNGTIYQPGGCQWYLTGINQEGDVVGYFYDSFLVGHGIVYWFNKPLF